MDKCMAIQVDFESLGEMSFEDFEPAFRAELESAFPDVSIEITCGYGSECRYSDMQPDDETVYECSKKAFKMICEKGATIEHR